MQIHYLEIVTPDVDSTCATHAKLHHVTFGPAVPELGQARTAPFGSGGMIGVRAPMHEAEESVIRPYTKVADLEVAVATAANMGAEIALSSMDIPGRGKIAIYILGGVQHGLWQV